MARLRLLAPLALGAVGLLAACNNYRVSVLYPSEGGGNIFVERPQAAIYVAEPVDVRPSADREGRGMIVTLHFPSDDKLDVPATGIVRRALLQDLATTKVAKLVSNPELADYVLDTQLLRMTTTQRRRGGAFAIPLMAGVALGTLGTLDVSAEHGFKLGIAGAVLGTLIPGPNLVGGLVEMHLELKDRVTGEVVWESVCTGSYEKSKSLGLSAREDKKLAEEFLPRALKKANACAIGQIYQVLQQRAQPAAGATSQPAAGS